MLIDATIFAGEMDMLRFRMRILEPYVDRFVVVEDCKTMQGAPRPWTLKNTTLPRVIPYRTDIAMDGQESTIEIGQRNGTVQACEQFDDDDLLIMSDVDEIPSREAVEELLVHPEWVPRTCELASFYYRLNHHRVETCGLIIARIKHLRELGGHNLSRDCRFKYPMLDLKPAGWHLSFFGGTDSMQAKIRSYGHWQFNRAEFLDREWLEKCQREGIGLFKCNTKVERVGPGFFPKYFLEAAPKEWWL